MVNVAGQIDMSTDDVQLSDEDAQVRRRLQCRISQKSFRDRKKREHEQIASTVESLQNDVAKLENQMASLVRQVPLELVRHVHPSFDGGVAAKIARQYIVLFKQGYNSTKRKMSAKQESFLRAIAHDDVRYNNGVGVESILKNWQRYTSTFSSINMDMPDCIMIKSDNGAVVKGIVRSYLKISRNSIAMFFPLCPEHLKPLLIGRILHVVATMHWCFDEEDRLIRLTGAANFESGLYDILQDFESVAFVLSGSPKTSNPIMFTRAFRQSPRFLALHRHFITTIDIPIPSMGPSMKQGRVVKWTKCIGDRIEQEDIVAIFETDKFTVDIRSPQAGILAKHLIDVKVPVDVGTPLFRLTQGDIHVDEPISRSKELMINVPFIGETVNEATVAQWLKGDGDRVKADEVIVVLDTVKVAVNVVAPANGVLKALPRVVAGRRVAAVSALKGSVRAFSVSPSVVRGSARFPAASFGSMRRMMSTIDIPVPSMGDSISEGTVVEWVKTVGDRVEADDVVVVLETDKVSVDVRSPQAGVIAEHLAQVDATVLVGAPLF
ncbi:dihydrolipoamide succinyltransferase, partial [Thraustotheca clavata]